MLSPFLILRLSRADRLPYILQRWKGKISVSVLAKENELVSLAHTISTYMNSGRIVFSVYVTKAITESNIPFYVQPNGTHLEYPEGFYPINTMRDLAIESISTTHCLVADVDMFPSDGLESSIDQYAEELCDHRNMVIVPTFQYNRNASMKQCFVRGNCDDLYFNAIRYDQVVWST